MKTDATKPVCWVTFCVKTQTKTQVLSIFICIFGMILWGACVGYVYQNEVEKKTQEIWGEMEVVAKYRVWASCREDWLELDYQLKTCYPQLFDEPGKIGGIHYRWTINMLCTYTQGLEYCHFSVLTPCVTDGTNPHYWPSLTNPVFSTCKPVGK